MSLTTSYCIDITEESDTEILGGRLAAVLEAGVSLQLCGDLGVGKTTLCRSIIRGMGHQGRVKSPTYTLVEPYEFDHLTLYHFDLYRLAEPSELEYVGYRDYFNPESICLVEWPERGAGMLPDPDLAIELRMEGLSRKLECRAQTGLGEKIIRALAQD